MGFLYVIATPTLFYLVNILWQKIGAVNSAPEKEPNFSVGGNGGGGNGGGGGW